MKWQNLICISILQHSQDFDEEEKDEDELGKQHSIGVFERFEEANMKQI